MYSLLFVLFIFLLYHISHLTSTQIEHLFCLLANKSDPSSERSLVLNMSRGIGSPPRVWGKVPAYLELLGTAGITPTRVGKSNNIQTVINTLGGSPPRVWGKKHSLQGGVRLLGITPTCVGKSHTWCMVSSPRQDHPHVCGEKGASDIQQRSFTGSPPRVWGKAKYIALAYLTGRITPTRVGKSDVYLAGCSDGQDHPHVCGEKT